MINCRTATRLISESFDRKLSLKERLIIGFHLLLCPHCRRYRRQLNLIRKQLSLWQNHS